jgi:hypothetical protein
MKGIEWVAAEDDRNEVLELGRSIVLGGLLAGGGDVHVQPLRYLLAERRETPRVGLASVVPVAGVGDQVEALQAGKEL